MTLERFIKNFSYLHYVGPNASSRLPFRKGSEDDITKRVKTIMEFLRVSTEIRTGDVSRGGVGVEHLTLSNVVYHRQIFFFFLRVSLDL